MPDVKKIADVNSLIIYIQNWKGLALAVCICSD